MTNSVHETAARVFAAPMIDIREGVPGVDTTRAADPLTFPEKKVRNTRHYKGELADMTRAHEQASVALRDALEREGTTALRLERAMYAAALTEGALHRKVEVWRLVALVSIALGALALLRVVAG